MEEHYIGIDLGASSGRVILGTLYPDSGKVAYETVYRFPTEGTYIFNTFRWNLLRFWEEIVKGLKVIASMDNVEPRGIGVDSWGVNLVYLTEDNEPACYTFHYRDDLIEEGDKYMRSVYDMARVYEITGIQDIKLNGLVHLCGIKKKYPEILKRTRKIVMIADYFAYLLTGRLTTEYTNATTTELFDAHKRTFSEEILSGLGLTPEIFPETLNPGTEIGKLHPDVREMTGLGPVPVYAIATHDTASAVLAVPSSGGDDWAYLSSGTWSLLGIEVDHPIITEKTRKLNLTNEGGAFGKIRFLKNIMGLWLVQRCRKEWEDAGEPAEEITYSALSESARSVQPKKFLIDVDAPDFFNPKSMISAIKNYCRRKGGSIPETKAEIMRCIYDSLAVRYAEVLHLIEEASGRNIKTLHIVGGGSQDRVLNSIIAEELGVTVKAGPVEATALGNIMMQAYASGSVKSHGEIRKIIASSFPISEYRPR